jgi:4'-phosphopantetheinyl transferase
MVNLGASDIHIWSIDTSAETDLDAAMSILGPEEHVRAAQLRFDAHRRRFVVAHAAARRILGAYTGLHPAWVIYDTDAFGAPRLHESIRGSLCFSLSHAGDRAAVALARGCRLGIDIEEIRNDIDYGAMVGVCLSDEETEALGRVPDRTIRRSMFFYLWTRKEAAVKAIGRGASFGLHNVGVPADSRRTWTALNLPPEISPLYAHTIHTDTRYAAAVASDTPRALHGYYFTMGGWCS